MLLWCILVVRGVKKKREVDKWMKKETVFTIGYTAFNVVNFIEVLKKNRITCLVDVRSNPNSRYYEDYNEYNIKRLLAENGIHYRNYKCEFGARQLNKDFYDKEGYMSFIKFSKSDVFQTGVSKIIAGINLGYVFAFMCAEKDPIDCHRNILVARQFYKLGYNVSNILVGGDIETQRESELRLVNKYYPNRNQLSLVDSLVDIEIMVEKSYEKKNKEIGFRLNEFKREDIV